MTRHGFTTSLPTSPVLPIDGWRSATRCGPNGGNCVEVNLAARDTTGVVGVRDSKPDQSGVLAFGPTGWRSFLVAAVGGDLRG
jgi:hypothetical protein